MQRLPILILILACVAAAATPASAQYRRGTYAGDNSLRVYVGQFEPDGESSYWDGSFDDFTGSASDFEDLTFGIDYSRNIVGGLRLFIGGSGFEGDTNQEYLDFVDTSGGAIVHNTSLNVQRATIGLAINLAPASSVLVPYLGVGGGLYFWELEESGEFIDFGVAPPEIFPATFFEDGNTFGWYYMGGIDIRVSGSFGVFVQARIHDAEDDLEGDFDGLGQLDLSGTEIAGGFSWSF